MENSVEVPQEPENRTTTRCKNSIPGHTCEKCPNLPFEKIHAPQYSEQHYLHLPRYGSNASVRQQVNELRRCAIHIYNGILFSQEKE